MIQLDGHQLSLWQKGRRLYTLDRLYRIRRWHPNTLFTSIMRRALFGISSGLDPVEAAIRATQAFMKIARDPGLDAPGLDTYKLAMDYCAMIQNILNYVSRTVLLKLYELKPIAVDLNVQGVIHQVEWKFNAAVDDSGTLHRWVFMDYITDDDIIRECHRWEVFGDIAAANSPMNLHVVSIGRIVDNRRYSPWTRAYKHPDVAGIYKFQKHHEDRSKHLYYTPGTEKKPWEPIYFADNISNDPAKWVDIMLADNIIDSAPLIRHVTIDVPTPQNLRTFRHDLLYESQQIILNQSLFSDPFNFPLCRNSCDTPFICPHQFICFHDNPSKATLESSGLYDKVT